MLTYPSIDPVALSLGPIQIHWYGIMYLLAFTFAWFLALRNSQRPWSPVKKTQVEDLIVYGAFGVILGGRLGYLLFYSADKWLADPTMLVRIWEGGMSFHGGLIGVGIALLIYSRKYQISFLSLVDFATPLVPTGLFFGRIGNFIGQELYGRPTDVPWAMVFPADPQQLARHPSQLYEAALEGLVLFFIINWYARKPRLYGEVTGLFLILYGTFRFMIEFVRQPDAQFVGQSALVESFNWMTRGQTLCIPMILLGLWFMRASLRGLVGKSGLGSA
ncbi:MAG: phosphatidylglycerol:prolipoprotein diacylglycerol transferase [Porticoccaceae bacterium]|jgi:phosphatidylglycerol:prolipoprotein diacylglycerol transferase|nr:prolipoprotein diacylglyceryl transferase [Porticoccaceae bacterium]